MKRLEHNHCQHCFTITRLTVQYTVNIVFPLLGLTVQYSQHCFPITRLTVQYTVNIVLPLLNYPYNTVNNVLPLLTLYKSILNKYYLAA